MTIHSENRAGLYYVIPAQIMDAEDLKPIEKLLYALLSGLADSEGKCFPSDEYLSKRLLEIPRQVKRYIKNLNDLGYISREIVSCSKNPFKKYRIITVNLSFKKVIQGTPQSPSMVTPQSLPQVTPQSLIESEENLIESEENLLCPDSRQDAKEALSKEGDSKNTSDVLKSRKSVLRETKPTIEMPKEASNLAHDLFNRVKAIHPLVKPPDLKKWALELERMHRLDGRSWEDVERVIKYAFEVDTFWVSVLQSPEKLRKNFDKIWIKMHSAQPAKSPNIEKNTQTAWKVKKILAESNEAERLIIYKNSVRNQNNSDSVSLDLPPATFEDVLLNWFGLRRKQ